MKENSVNGSVHVTRELIKTKLFISVFKLINLTKNKINSHKINFIYTKSKIKSKVNKKKI